MRRMMRPPPMSEQSPQFRHVQTFPKFSILTVLELPEADEDYNHILLRLPGGYERRISHTDAQRLGIVLNRAGGGVL
jgi:hypothetical protein